MTVISVSSLVTPAAQGVSPRSKGLVVGQAKRSFVQQLFTSIARRYDWFNRLVSLGLDQRWRREAVRRAGVAPGMRTLDVCAGTGDLAILCASVQGGQGRTVGVDMNAAMLAYAKQKQQREGTDIGWLRGDALQLPFPDGSFDRVLIGFSTRNLTDLAAGLTDMLRVLRSGGRLVILETGWPSHPLLRMSYQAFLFTIARAIGVILTGRLWPFTYLARSVREFLTPTQVCEHLRALGVQVQYQPLSGGLASLYIASKPRSTT